MISYKLLNIEKDGMIYAPSINTITIFQGSVCLQTVEARFNDIVATNPWLMSKLIRSEEFNEIVAVYPSEITSAHLSVCFQSMSNSSVSLDLEYNNLMKEVSNCLVPIGFNCIDKDIPLFRVTLIETKRDEEFAIVVSLSHKIGDGYTFYSIYSLFNCNSPLQSLICTREMSFDAQVTEATDKELQEWFASPCFAEGIRNTINSGIEPIVCAYTLNKEEINSIKSKYTEKSNDSSFLSTNDIITSWFCSLCDCQFGFVVVNFRNRLKSITKDLAGNYHSMLVYNKKCYDRPEHIRESLTTFNRGSEIPTEEETLEFNVSQVTNWSTFYQTIQLSNCDDSKIKGHLPLYNMSDVNFKNVCIIFQLNADTTAVMLVTRRCVDVVDLVNKNDPSMKLLKNRIL